MLIRLRSIAGSAALLLVLAACGGSTEPTAVPTAVPIGGETAIPSGGETAVPVDGSAYPAPASAVPAAVTAYPGTDSSAPLDAPSAYPGATTTP